MVLLWEGIGFLSEFSGIFLERMHLLALDLLVVTDFPAQNLNQKDADSFGTCQA